MSTEKHQKEIRSAIGAHGQWKLRLTAAARSGQGDLDPATISLEDQCAFGKWLKSVEAEMGGDETYDTIVDMHRKFHRNAGDVASLINAGQAETALANLREGSVFSDHSKAMTFAMTDWRLAFRRAEIRAQWPELWRDPHRVQS